MTQIYENMPQSDRAELWGRLIDVVEDWLDEKGFTSADFPNDDREGDDDEAIIFGSDYDKLANNFAAAIGISRDHPDLIGNAGAHASKQEADAVAMAENLLSFVNALGYDSQAFADTICRAHRTLQQSVMRLFIETVRKMATVTPDSRNAAAVALAKEIAGIADRYPLPLI